MAKITTETKIGDLLKNNPKAAKVLLSFNLDCAGCGGADQESIANGAMAHGLDPDEIVKALNDALK